MRTIIINCLLIIYCIVIVAAYISDNSYLLEYLSTLLPYWITLNFILIITIIIWKRGKVIDPITFLTLISPVIFTTTFLTLIFYDFSFSKDAIGDGQQAVTVAFLNKLYSNNNYQEIDKKITLLHPDIIGFSELTETDRLMIQTLRNYPCTFSKSSRDNSTVALFSKYPCSVNDSISSRYILPINIQLPDNKYQIFVIHPVPPSTPQWLKDRDEELTTLARYVNTQSNIIILGDFNLSPWSRTYRRISSEMTTIKNSARGAGLKFTWQLSLLQTQIDHIFIPKTSKVEHFESYPVEGSDHNLVLTKIKI